jgi:hypothetical protein
VVGGFYILVRLHELKLSAVYIFAPGKFPEVFGLLVREVGAPREFAKLF